jgi:hypothetical protein
MDLKTDLADEIMDSSEYVFSCEVAIGEPPRRAEAEKFRAAQGVLPETRARNIKMKRGSQAALTDCFFIGNKQIITV